MAVASRFKYHAHVYAEAIAADILVTTASHVFSLSVRHPSVFTTQRPAMGGCGVLDSTSSSVSLRLYLIAGVAAVDT